MLKLRWFSTGQDPRRGWDRTGILAGLAAAGAVAAAAVGGLETMRQEPPEPVVEVAYDAYAEGVTMQFHHTDGAPVYSLRAFAQTRFKDGGVEWTQPSLRWFQESVPERFQTDSQERSQNPGQRESAVEWRARALRGAVPSTGDRLRLSGDVELSRGGGGDADVVLITAALDFDLAAETLATDQPVQMMARGLRQSAAGLTLHLPEDRLRLQGDIRGSHVRP